MPRKESIEQMFDGIAPSYDRLNHLLSLDADRAWRRKAVRQVADEKKPLTVLDVACGTGDLTIAIARRLRKLSGGKVTGIDLSERMLEIGRKKVASAGLDAAAELRQGDGESLPYGDGSFDRVTIAFGIRNFAHREKGLEEMRRVLVPGGKVVILELSMPEGRIVRPLYRFYFTKILPLVGRAVSGDEGPYSYLPASVIGFPAPDDFCAMMRGAGFANVRHKALTFGICRLYTGEREA